MYPTNSGLIQDVYEVGRICESRDTVYLVDACQSVGQIPIDVKRMKCDFLSVTGRKFLRGPRGTGFLYVSDRILQRDYAPLFIDLRGATWMDHNQMNLEDTARRFETWEMSYALLVGLTQAIKYAQRVGINAIEKYNRELCFSLREKVNEIDGLSVLDHGDQLASIVTFSTSGSFETLKAYLLQNNVFFSTIDYNSAIYDFGNKNVRKAFRLSPHYFNTVEEIVELIHILDQYFKKAY